MKKMLLAVIALAMALAISPVALADNVIYQATSSDHNNGLQFGPDGTANPPLSSYWEMGNTISFSGSSSYALGLVDITLYGGGDTSYPIQMDIYSGSNPNSGTLLGTETAPAGFGVNTTVFNFDGLTVPDTITYILSLPNQNGSYDSIFLYPIMTSGAAPTVGSGPNSLWYGIAPGDFVANNTYAEADGAGSNYLQAEFTATPAPEPSSLLFLGTGLLGMGFLLRKKAMKARPVSSF